MVGLIFEYNLCSHITRQGKKRPETDMSGDHPEDQDPSS